MISCVHLVDGSIARNGDLNPRYESLQDGLVKNGSAGKGRENPLDPSGREFLFGLVKFDHLPHFERPSESRR